MRPANDIRAQIEADALLQQEISRALLATADTLASGSDPRVVRILTRTLEASWAEHVSFQDQVIFPILVGRHGDRIVGTIERGRSEHASLAQQHFKIGRLLDALLGPGHLIADGLEYLMRATHAERLRHLELDAEFYSWLPETFTEAECVLCGRWWASRPKLRFPLNLLRRAGRPFPRLGGRLH